MCWWRVIVVKTFCDSCILFLVESSPKLPSVADISPLNYNRFLYELQSHPDKQWVEFILHGILEGFKLGFNPAIKLKAVKKNKASAHQQAHIIDAYLDNEVQRGRLAGPFDLPPISPLQVSGFGVIPKKGQPGKWRLIFDLSSPLGYSVNDGINPGDCSLQYINLDDIVHMVAKLGRGALLAKFDIESAYRNVPIHPTDRHLLGMKWRSKYYVDLALPFGLRSAPFIFNSIASSVEWILRSNYDIPDILHYLDDFVLAGPPGSPLCHSRLSTATSVTADLGLPLHPDKCVGPATCLVVLGIEIDTLAETLRLPTEKFAAILELLRSWSSRKSCRKKELQSLIGVLHHACKVVWPGRTFLRRMIDLLKLFKRGDHPIRLNVEFRRDLQWWLKFFNQWNGISFFLIPSLVPPPTVCVGSDASGAIGYGAYLGAQWFNGKWLPQQLSLSIAYKELFPVVLAAHVWGYLWERQRVLFKVDNQSVVAILNSRTSRDPDIMALMRSLLFAAARFSFSFSAEHVPGVTNGVADALSRFHMQAFRNLAPHADHQPTVIPMQLLASLGAEL